MFDILKGKTLTKIEGGVEDERLTFHTSDGMKYVMYHDDDCCETVYIEDICGDFEDLYNQPILLAEEVSNSDDEPKYKGEESYTWTYYKLSTNLGSVTIRWYGSSNGYYSERVDFKALCYGCMDEISQQDGFCYECDKKVADYIPVEQKIKYWETKYG